MAAVTVIPASVVKTDVLRVAAYCRVSSDSADQLHSYAAQIRNYTEVIEKHDGWKLIDVYAEAGVIIGYWSSPSPDSPEIPMTVSRYSGN